MIIAYPSLLVNLGDVPRCWCFFHPSPDQGSVSMGDSAIPFLDISPVCMSETTTQQPKKGESGIDVLGWHMSKYTNYIPIMVIMFDINQ
jgi:hypothetical protein